MNTAVRANLLQRADYTHKFNAKTGRHGWLRLTPAYSVKIVEELILQCERPMRIFDPFCGTATTALSAAYHGHEGVTTDINPFLVHRFQRSGWFRGIPMVTAWVVVLEVVGNMAGDHGSTSSRYGAFGFTG